MHGTQLPEFAIVLGELVSSGEVTLARCCMLEAGEGSSRFDAIGSFRIAFISTRLHLVGFYLCLLSCRHDPTEWLWQLPEGNLDDDHRS